MAAAGGGRKFAASVHLTFRVWATRNSQTNCHICKKECVCVQLRPTHPSVCTPATHPFRWNFFIEASKWLLLMKLHARNTLVMTRTRHCARVKERLQCAAKVVVCSRFKPNRLHYYCMHDDIFLERRMQLREEQTFRAAYQDESSQLRGDGEFGGCVLRAQSARRMNSE